MQVLPRDLFVVKEETDGETGAAYWGDYRDSRVQLVIFMSNNDINWLRDYLPATTIEAATRVCGAQPIPEH